MMARIDMEYQAELKHELKCMQKISHKTKRKHPDINDLRGEKKRQQIKATVKPIRVLQITFVTILNTGELIKELERL